jgi:hypothetical protein
MGDWNKLASGRRLAIPADLLENEKIRMILACMNLLQNSADSRPICSNHYEQITGIES